MTRPMVADGRPRRRFLAMSFARYPRASTAPRTRDSVSGRTPASWFTTRETVLRLTPASLATSTIVGRSLIPAPDAILGLRQRCQTRSQALPASRCQASDRSGTVAHGMVCDVSSESQVRSTFDQVAAMGSLGFLVNAAGVGRFGPVEDLTEAMIDEVLAANLKGLMLATAAALPALRATGGTVVSVLSSAALVGRAEEAVYCAAKWGARGFMEALRIALKGTSVRTLTVYPGGMRTAFWSPETGRMPDLTDYMDPRHVARQILRVALDPGAAHVTEMT